MPNQPANPNTDAEEWLRVLKASGDEPHVEDDPARLAVIVEAMRQSGDALTPSEETRRTTWRQVEQAMENRLPPVQSGWLSLSRRFWSMHAFAPALLASGAILVVGVLVLTMQNKDADITVIAMRGGTQQIAIQNFSAPQPKPVQELREMGLQVEMQREATQILLTIPVSDPPPPALLAWATRWGITPMPGDKWHIVLVSSSKNSHE